MKAIGIINLCNSPSLGVLTRDKSFGAVSFLGRYALLDFAIANLINSGIDNISIVTDERYDDVRSYIFVNDHNGLKKASIRVVTDRDCNDLQIMKNNVTIDKDYVVVVSPKYVAAINYDEVLKQHISSKAEITAISNMESYVFSKDTFLNLLESSSSFKEVMETQKERVKEYDYKGLVVPILSLEQYIKESFALLEASRRKELFKPNWPIYTTIANNAPTKYGDNAEVDNCIIGTGCFIRGTVKDSIIAQGVTIDESARVDNCILFSNIYIGQRLSVKKAVLCNDVSINGVRRVCGDEEEYVLIQEGVKL